MNSSIPSDHHKDLQNKHVSVHSHRQPYLQQKRARIQLSCAFCRSAKLKCDRQQPCSNCTKRDRGSSCTFPPPTAKKGPPLTMQKRLKHLEDLLKDVMHGQTPDSHQTPPSDGHRSGAEEDSSSGRPAVASGPSIETNGASLPKENSSGQVLLGAKERSSYVGATHWAAILDDIEEVKSYFKDIETEDWNVFENIGPDTSLLFGSASPLTKSELLDALPQRNIVDRLVSRYFNTNNPALYIIHRPTFQKQYRDFWVDPFGYPTSFLGLLYSMLCLSTLGAAALGTGEDHLDSRGTPIEMVRAYRGYCTRCLVLSNYTNPGPHILESLLIYMEGEFVLSEHDQMNCYLLIGIAVRLALRMGLHRDATKVGGNITPFQAELRRRHWLMLVQIDLLASFHIGLPSMVHTIESDTLFPQNLMDTDLDENSSEIPQGRPLSEPTPMTYTIVKGNICYVFGKVASQANLLSLPDYPEIMKLDCLLDEAYSKVPSFLLPKPLDQSITDSPELIIQRFSISLLYHKTRCVLHRKYLMKEKENKEYSYSKRAGLDSSMNLLHSQSEIHEAVQLGGPLWRDKWVLSSLSMHDFLLAAMIVYLSVIQSIEEAPNADKSTLPRDPQQRNMISALERSYTIWMTTRDVSMNAKKASDVLAVMLKKVESIIGQPIAMHSLPTTTGPEYSNGGSYISGLSINDADPSSLWQATSFNHTTSSPEFGIQYSVNNTDLLSAIPTEPLDGIISMPMNFDWETFDNHIRSGQATADQTWPDLSVDDFDIGNEEMYNL